MRHTQLHLSRIATLLLTLVACEQATDEPAESAPIECEGGELHCPCFTAEQPFGCNEGLTCGEGHICTTSCMRDDECGDVGECHVPRPDLTSGGYCVVACDAVGDHCDVDGLVGASCGNPSGMLLQCTYPAS